MAVSTLRQYDVFADQILKAEAIPHRYVQSMDRADLESKKATEHFADGALKGNPDDDSEDGDGVFDDYGDVYDLGFFDDDDDSPSLAELECMADEMYALREDAVECVADAAEVIQSADALLMALDGMKHRLHD